tara:strand:+ start:180 stop:563 length:384 start_codon:yes stop_codon:yes gene_type:complete
MNYLEEYNLNQEISEFTLKINDDYSNRYAEVCGIENYNSEYVNPTELATLSLKYFLEQFPIPEGSIHTAQEVEIFKKIKRNDEFKGVIMITNYKEIKESLFIKIKTNYLADNEIIASSEGTLVVPKK